MKTSKRVLFISYDGLTDSLGQAQILPYLMGLAEKGHQLTILSCEKEQNFKKNCEIVLQKTKSANIQWEHTHYDASYPVLSPMLNSRRLKKKAVQLFKSKAFDVVHCRSIIPAGIAYKLSKNHPVKVVFDIRGFWADERVDGKIWNLKNPLFQMIYHYFKQKEKKLFEQVDAIVTLTENAKDYIASHFTTKEVFTVVPCCVDFNHFDLKSIQEEDRQKLRVELGIPQEDYVLVYVGSLGARYMLEEMLLFFKELKKKKSNASFLFISKSDTSEIEELCRKNEIDFSSIYITSCEYAEIPLYISIGNASVFFIVTSFSGKAVSPTKQAEVMSLGLPIITNTGLGDTDAILQETKNGIIVKSFSSDDYGKAIEELVEFKKTREEVRTEAVRLFNLQSGIDRYHALYEKL